MQGVTPKPRGAARVKPAADGLAAQLQDTFDRWPLRRPEEAVGFWLWRLSNAYQRRVEARLAALDLTHLQFVMLSLSAWLALQAPAVRQRDRVEISGVQDAQVSLIVKALKAKRLVVQRPSREDARVRLIVLTQAGAQRLADALPLMTALQEELWPPGRSTDRLRLLLAETLRRWDARHD